MRMFHGCLLLAVLAVRLPAQETNDLFRVAPAVELGAPVLEVTGEVADPGPVDLAGLPRSEVVVREAVLTESGAKFRGAFRYEGYALLDILRARKVRKANAAEFNLPLDLGVLVENRAGEKVLVGWGEVFFASQLRRIIVADRVAPIPPHKVKVNWTLPAKPKLVCADDLLAERNLEDPVKLTVFSARRSFTVTRNLKPLYSGQVGLFRGDEKQGDLKAPGREDEVRSCPVFFYGRGMGYHGRQDFRGALLGRILQRHFPVDRERLRRGYFLLAGADGYRLLLSYSELCNRSDNAEWLLIDRGRGGDGGRYSLYPAPDFFSDRAVKALRAVHLERAE